MGKILINNNLYGVDVEANPTGTPTERLNSITINGVSYYLPSGGGGSAKVKLKYIASTPGSSTWTADEAGNYLVIAAYSYQGSASITFPDTLIAPLIYSLEADSRGAQITFSACNYGDRIIVDATPAAWQGYAALIFKLDDDITFPSSQLVRQLSIDARVEVASITGSGDALFIGVACGHNLDYTYECDYSDYSEDLQFQGIVNKNTIIRICYGDIADYKPFRLFGYDGGFAGVIALQ